MGEFSQTIIRRKTVDLSLLEKTVIGTPSSNMGASSVNDPCDRKLWLKFRWAVDEKVEPKLGRIFSLGGKIEGELVSYLEELGLEMKYTGEDQVKVFLAPHFVCKPDGLVLSGVPGAEKTEHALELKSVNLKHFKELQSKGIKEAKPEHYIQCQCEMEALSRHEGRRIERALYVAYCKDDSKIYAERVDRNDEEIQYVISRAENIRKAEMLPPAISDDPTLATCKWCPYSVFCFVSHEAENINCRTCLHSTAEEDGTWSCALDKKYGWGIGALTYEMQKSGCKFHSFRPDLVPFTFIPEASTEDAAAYEIGGEIYLDGYGGITSSELKKKAVSPHREGWEVTL